ncbi:MAG: hypothetical protein R2851_16665 [Caldilineaceae bacterium]
MPPIVPTFFGGPCVDVPGAAVSTATLPNWTMRRIDGCSSFGELLAHHHMPLGCRPFSSSDFRLQRHVNEFLLPLIYLQSPDNLHAGASLRMFREASTSWNLLMVAPLLTMLPVIFFFVSQRYFIQGIVFTGVKS